jgi:beta-lactamase class A
MIVHTPRIIAMFVMFSTITFCQLTSLRNRIEHIIDRSHSRIGAAVINVHTGDTLTFHNEDRFPMQSVYKFPVALAMLHQIDQRKFALDQRIHVSNNDLLPNTWSPLREKYPNGNVELTLDEIIAATVAQSDNNGCDILFRLLGGPANVDRYIRSLGISRMTITATEQEMHTAWNIQYQNWSSPFAMATLLYRFYHDSILSTASRDYLWRIMVNTVTGVNRLKGKLPEGTIVGHKTGSSGTNDAGMAAATNDVGIVMMPGNIPVVIVVFVSDSSAPESDRDAVIAEIAHAVWEELSHQ